MIFMEKNTDAKTTVVDLDFRDDMDKQLHWPLMVVGWWLPNLFGNYMSKIGSFVPQKMGSKNEYYYIEITTYKGL